MLTLPRNAPAILKYLPFYASLTPSQEAALFDACVRHGMEKYGKTRAEAEATESRNIANMKLLFRQIGRLDHTAREKVFQTRVAYAESNKSWGEWIKYVEGNVVEIGSGGMPCVEWAIQCELSPKTYALYNAGQQQEVPAQWRSDEPALPFKDGTIDTCVSSHLIEDFLDWLPPLTEWTRIVKPGGHIIILLPDKEAWQRALRNGQPPNCQHTHESHPGELTTFFKQHFPHFEVLEDRLLSHLKPDYTIMFCAKRAS